MTETPSEKIRIALKRYEAILQRNGMTATPQNWIALGVGSAFILSLIGFLVFGLLGLDSPILLAIVTFFMVIDLILGYPIALDLQRISQIEEAFPNVLKQLADTLKAGGTYEYALREVSESDYGPLTGEIKLVLRRIEEGENLDKSLELMRDNIDSRLVKRTLSIIVDALKSGGGLSEILDDIANDMRDMHRIQLERKSKTLMQVLFLITAGSVVGPAILGFATSTLEFLIDTAAKTGAVPAAQIQYSIAAKQLLAFTLTGYIVIIGIAAGILLGLMRDGKAKQSIIYMPILLFVALVIFYVARIATKILIGGNGP